MRVYLPSNVADLESLSSPVATLSGRVGFSLLPEWIKGQSEQDPEVLEHELLMLAALASLENGRRVVIVADLPVSEIDPSKAQVKVPAFGSQQILAYFTDDRLNLTAILAGEDPQELALTWFGPGEIQEILDFIQP